MSSKWSQEIVPRMALMAQGSIGPAMSFGSSGRPDSVTQFSSSLFYHEQQFVRVKDYFPPIFKRLDDYVSVGEKALDSSPVKPQELQDVVSSLHSLRDLAQRIADTVKDTEQTQQGVIASLAQFKDILVSAAKLADHAKALASFIAQEYDVISGAYDQVGLGAFPSEEEGGPPSSETLARMRVQNRRALGLAGFSSNGPSNGLGEFPIGAAVRRVRVRTQFTPDFEYVPGTGGQPDQVKGGGGAVLGPILKPEVEVETPLGTVRSAPYGRPTQNYFPLVVGAVVVGAAVVGTLAARGLGATIAARRKKNPARRRARARRRYAIQ